MPARPPTPPDRGLVAAFVGWAGGIRPAQRLAQDHGVKLSRGFLDGQLRGQAKTISKGQADNLSKLLTSLPAAQRKDVRDLRRVTIQKTANEPKRMAAEAKRLAKQKPTDTAKELREFRRQLRNEQKGSGGGGGGGSGGGAGGEVTSDDDLMEQYGEYLMTLDEMQSPDFQGGGGWDEPEDLPF